MAIDAASYIYVTGPGEERKGNYFNQNTRIKFLLAQEEKVKLSVYYLLGHEVATLVNENKAAGSHIVNFSANKLLPGTYFYRIQAGEITESRKLVILK